jgi:hypothetical protein
MATAGPQSGQIRVIFASPSTVESAKILNPNVWPPRSRGIIQSCSAEFSAFHHCIEQIRAMCKDRENLCQSHIKSLQQQWALAKFELGKAVYFGEQPDLHMRIESFLSGVKSLLDLLVQLLSSERVVAAAVHGFHRDRDVYGGSVLKVLQNNARKDRKSLAGKMKALLIEHKKEWIDEVIRARDDLIHPQKGMLQLMFQLDFVEQDGNVVCTQINPPAVGTMPIDQYAYRTLQHASTFISAFTGLLQDARAMSTSEDD